MASHQQKCDSLQSLKLQLPFDTHQVCFLILTDMFVDSAEVTRWIRSVTQPFLKPWYDGCLLHPDNALLLNMATALHSDFSEDIVSELMNHHDSVALNGHFTRCSCHGLSLSKSLGSLDFEQYTIATACLIARYSIRGNIRENEDD
jgi:hypothetical protein